jgi:hypothetical protein
VRSGKYDENAVNFSSISPVNSTQFEMSPFPSPQSFTSSLHSNQKVEIPSAKPLVSPVPISNSDSEFEGWNFSRSSSGEAS